MTFAGRLVSVGHFAIEIAVSLLLLFCVADAHAQVSRVGATLEGTVRDSSGAVMPQVAITLRNTLTNQGRTVMTNYRGLFRAEQLAVGTYEIRLERTGFAPYQRARVIVSLGQTVHLDIVLAPASPSAELTVSA